MKKKIHHHSCTIRRTFKRWHGTMNMATGKTTKGKSEIVTEPCNTPIFEDLGWATGVCRSCREGWEVRDNRFENDAEKARAMRACEGSVR